MGLGINAQEKGTYAILCADCAYKTIYKFLSIPQIIYNISMYTYRNLFLVDKLKSDMTSNVAGNAYVHVLNMFEIKINK